MRSRLSLLLTALLAGGAMAQTSQPQHVPPPLPTGVVRPLPSGVVQQGNVIMMAPVDSSVGGDSGSTVSSERRPSAVRVLSATDHDLYSRAMDLGDRGDWIGAQGLASQGHDTIAQRIITWRYLMDQNSGASFAQIDSCL
jgi:hypothetical protein